MFHVIHVMQGGYSGWTSSKLQTKLSNTVSAVEILAPVFGTQKKAPSGNGRVSFHELTLGLHP